MIKFFFALLMTTSAGVALAEIKCTAMAGEEVLEVRVIDTFVERTAFITRTHPAIRFPLVSLPVKAFEKSKSVSFVNVDEDFHLSVDKALGQRTLPPTYQAELLFGEISTEMDCSVE